MQGLVLDVRPVLQSSRLKVVARVRTEDWGEVDAFLPDRELSAILPRSVLLGESRSAPPGLLETISPIIRRISGSRKVRIWKYQDSYYFSFLSWKGVTFVE